MPQGHDRREGITSAATGFASFSALLCRNKFHLQEAIAGNGAHPCRDLINAEALAEHTVLVKVNTAVQRFLHLRDTALHEDNLLSSVGGVWRFIQATCAGSSPLMKYSVWLKEHTAADSSLSP